MNTLLQMLAVKRPHGSKEEEAWVQKWLVDDLSAQCDVQLLGPMHNVCITIAGDPDTMFSSHTDTVHMKPGVQEVVYDANTAVAYKSDGECLGADDTTGVWLMREMILAGVPGTYVFHRGEERGGIGSRWIAANMQSWLKTFKRAIAFDRRDVDSVITKQRGYECCSDDFALALAARLGVDWKPDLTGTFTDTANYTDFIPECTNLSIGYYDQHTKDEMQDMDFAMAMRELCVKLDWKSLPTVRKAGPRPVTAWAAPKSFNSWKANRLVDDNWDFDFSAVNSQLYSRSDDIDVLLDRTHEEINAMCRNSPLLAADALYDSLREIEDARQEQARLLTEIEALEEEIEIRDRLINKLQAERKPLTSKILSALGKTRERNLS